MRSGYGIYCKTSVNNMNYLSTLTPPQNSITTVQSTYAYYPEFGYSKAKSKYDSMQKIANNNFNLAQNNHSDNSSRVHFTPLWFPDNDYIVQCYATDLWTPLGVISKYKNSNPIDINGSCYDDWYIGIQ